MVFVSLRGADCKLLPLADSDFATWFAEAG